MGESKKTNCHKGRTLRAANEWVQVYPDDIGVTEGYSFLETVVGQWEDEKIQNTRALGMIARRYNATDGVDSEHTSIMLNHALENFGIESGVEFDRAWEISRQKG